MKTASLPILLLVIFFAACSSAQAPPSLENGWKPYGSYDGSHLDSVNLMNGNVMFHVPLVPDQPQRGSLKFSHTLFGSSKDWQLVCTIVGGTQSCSWRKGGAGVGVQTTPWLSVHRTLDTLYPGIGGSTVYEAFGYSIVTADQSTHQLHGVAGTEDAYGNPTQFDSVDLSGFHVVLSSPDTNGVLSQVMVTDRSGNQYQGTFHTTVPCPRPANMVFSVPGPYQPMVDDSAIGDRYCSQVAFTSLVTDSNGNQIAYDPAVVDTMGRAALTGGGATTDFSGCVSPYPFVTAVLYPYQDPNGVTRNIKFCTAEIPIHTAFGIWTEAITSTDPLSGLHFIPVVTVIFGDGSKLTFDYDNYGEITSIGLPTGGSIAYTWGTISHQECNASMQTPLSRAVMTRTLNDGQGHSYVWTYQWGSPVNYVRTNVVTDPLGNDTVHVFSDLLQVAGQPTIGCNYYEISTIEYQGPQSAGQMLRRNDTTYTAEHITMDADSSSATLSNVFATDVVTTVYPSGMVKKVHRDPDPGLGSGLPGFGNVVRELEYDWGKGAPGALLRETDTVYQWQKNSGYLTARLLDLPASKVVISPVAAANTKANCPVSPTATANCMAEAGYAYDEAGYLTTPSPAVTTQHASPPYGVRGNLTTISAWLNTSNSFVSSHTNWYDTGEPYQKIDPLGHTTTLTYDPAYVGAYVTQTCSPATGTVAHCVSGAYDFTTGFLTSFTGQNGETSDYAYDLMFRLTSAKAPPDPANGNARATTALTYDTGAFPWTLTRTKPVTNTLTDSATTSLDGVGRAFRTQHAMPSGPPATVDTTFDGLDHPATVTNPYFTTLDPTYGVTQTSFDALGRPAQVTKQDGGVSSVAYNVVTVSPNGNCTQSADEAGHVRRSCADAMGRLIEVDEQNPQAAPSSGAGTVTISGSEQPASQSGAPGRGSVTISGQESSTQICTTSCHTVWDQGTISITVGSYPAKSVSYSQTTNTTAAAVAYALSCAFHNDPTSPVDAPCPATQGTSVTVDLTARTNGLATNYALSVSVGTRFPDDPSYFASAPAAMSGAIATTSNPDTGSVTITVNGTGYSTTYGGTDTPSSIASNLAAIISAGSWANASANGGTVTVTAKSAGPGTNYPMSASYTYNSANYVNPSFTTAASGSALTGGYSASDINNNPYVTLYSYDALGNLLCVEQHGAVSGTGCSAPPSNDATSPWRVRRFTYDSFSRLLTAANPESGTISYVYDNDGNLLQKTSPAPNQTGTATQTISYCYDALHRVTGRQYSAATCPLSAPVVSYSYDQNPDGTTTNAIGRLTRMTDQAGKAIYSYDILGRLVSEIRTLPDRNGVPDAVSMTVGYDYNLDGSLKALRYPSGAVVTYTPDSAGRVLSAVDSGSAVNYVSSATYGPDGAVTGFINGNSASFAGITRSFSYNKRLQPVNMSAVSPTQTVFSLGYDFHLGNGDNGNVYGITNFKDQTRNQTFTYDVLNRLLSAKNAGTDCNVILPDGNKKFWGNNYVYDAWGNLLQKGQMSGTCAGEGLGVTVDVNSRISSSGYAYDAAGNMTSDGLGHSYNYDQENRIIGAAGYTYTYDGDGNRVRKSNGTTASSGTLYWYMTPGIVAESDLAGTLNSEYVFFGGERVARRDLAAPAGVAYYFSDHLKTASVITSATGGITAESDYYPWGGELQFVNADSNHYKFTGKERDTETDLDYFGARYYSNGLGRFITHDWSSAPVPIPYADLSDPQSLNQYSYVRNVPTVKVDFDGHGCPPVCDLPTDAEVRQLIKEVGESIAKGEALASAARTAVFSAILIGAYAASPWIQTVGQSDADERTQIEQFRQERMAQNDGVDPQQPQLGQGRGAGEQQSQSDIARERARTGGGFAREVDFSGHLKQDLEPGQKNSIDIQYTGSRRGDFAAANKAAGFKSTPEGYTWHHVPNYDVKTNTGTMQLVKSGPHRTHHYGGVRQYEQAHKKKYGR